MFHRSELSQELKSEKMGRGFVPHFWIALPIPRNVRMSLQSGCGVRVRCWDEESGAGLAKHATGKLNMLTIPSGGELV
jgi:hypothetical protein